MPKDSHELMVFILISIITILAMGGFIITILFLYKKKQIQFITELRNIKIDHEKDLLKTQIEIQEETFDSISREIHDNINLSLTLAKLNLNTLNGDQQIPNEKLIVPIELISNVIADLTTLSRTLNSDIIKECGLITGLSLEISRLKKLTRPEVTFEISGNTVFLSAEKELIVFRILQESFNNILKHAKANNLFLHLHYDPEYLLIEIRDDGCGFLINQLYKKSGSKFSSGLKSIEKRVKVLGGQFNLSSQPGSGTQTTISIPIKSQYDTK